MTSEGFKQQDKHRPGCHAEHDDDGLTFIVHVGTRHDLRRNGTLGGSTMWHKFRCNDLQCGALMLVRWDVLARFVSGGVK